MILATLMGAAHRDAAARSVVQSLREGDVLTLERDRDNVYDENAVRVMWNDVWIGFLERGVAAEVGPRMDDGEPFHCVVHMFPEGTGSQRLKPLLRIE